MKSLFYICCGKITSNLAWKFPKTQTRKTHCHSAQDGVALTWAACRPGGWRCRLCERAVHARWRRRTRWLASWSDMSRQGTTADPRAGTCASPRSCGSQSSSSWSVSAAPSHSCTRWSRSACQHVKRLGQTAKSDVQGLLYYFMYWAFATMPADIFTKSLTLFTITNKNAAKKVLFVFDYNWVKRKCQQQIGTNSWTLLSNDSMTMPAFTLPAAAMIPSPTTQSDVWYLLSCGSSPGGTDHEVDDHIYRYQVCDFVFMTQHCAEETLACGRDDPSWSVPVVHPSGHRFT